MSAFTLDNPFAESRLNSNLDYRPDWDVTSLNERAVQTLVAEIRQSQGRTQPNPAQMIPVILAAPGYGKTHLFGRISHLLQEEIFFVFVPGIEDLSRPLEHICSHAVENLFRSTPANPSPLVRALARLCHPSVLEYFSQFPPSVAARYQALSQALQQNPAQVLDITAAVKDLPPFLRLAESIADRMPGLRHDVIKALALGWSPASDQVRRWLKGETLPEGELQRLDLSEDPPPPIAVFQGIAAIFQYRIPMILCCDQFEIPIVSSSDLTNKLTALLMSILEKVPNQVLIISCLEGEWTPFKEKAMSAFLQRVRKPELKLDYLKEVQGVDLVARRVQGLPGRPATAARTWPFDEASILAYIRDRSPTPRALIQTCEPLFAEWVGNGRQGVILLGKGSDGLDPARTFLQLWNREIEKIRADQLCKLKDYPEDRLYRAVREALRLAREAGREMGGVCVKNIQEGGLTQGGSRKRYALTVDLTASGNQASVLVPVTALNSGHLFRYYFTAIVEKLTDATAGALLVHRNAEFEMGRGTQEAFDEAVNGRRLNLFALEDNLPSFERLECLLRFYDNAVGQLLQLDGVTLSLKDCQDYLIKTAVLDNLELFKALASFPTLAPAGVSSQPMKPPPGKVVAVAVGAAASVATVSVHSSSPRPDFLAHLAGVTTAPGPSRTPVSASSSPGSEPVESVQTPLEVWGGERLALLVKKLTLWGQPVKPDGVVVGPAFARLKVVPAGAKTTFNKIRDKGEDIKIHLGLPIEPLIDSQAGYISVDVQLPHRRTVTLADVLVSPPALDGEQPVCPAGVDVVGKTHWLDLSDTSDCHLLVAGQTGSGKSEFLRALVAGLARRLSPDVLQFILIDPKRVTFNLGTLESPYLKSAIALDTESALPLLKWCQEEMNRRYGLLAQQKKTNVSQLSNSTSLIPRIVVIIDEFANLLEDKKSKPLLTSLLKQIGSMARAAGIHLVLATQRPDKDVVTPLLRDNLPGRIAFQVKTEASSKLIIGSPNACYLLGKGDLLWQHGGGLLRLQSPFVTQAGLEEVLRAH